MTGWRENKRGTADRPATADVRTTGIEDCVFSKEVFAYAFFDRILTEAELRDWLCMLGVDLEPK
jgi:hypothetical protein